MKQKANKLNQIHHPMSMIKMNVLDQGTRISNKIALLDNVPKAKTSSSGQIN